MDSTPKNHGIAGANKYIKMCKSKLSPSHQKVVAFLIQTHNMENLDNIRKFANSLFPNYNKQLIDVLCDMSNIVRDADALDRTRFPIFSFDYLNSKLLTHASAIELIEVAQTINYRQAFRPARKCMEDNTKKIFFHKVQHFQEKLDFYISISSIFFEKNLKNFSKNASFKKFFVFLYIKEGCI